MNWICLALLGLSLAQGLIEYQQQPARPTEYEEFGTYFVEEQDRKETNKNEEDKRRWSE